MSIKKKIRKTCLLTLGCNPEPDNWNTWDQIMQLSEAFGERKVAEAFDEWAESRKGDTFKKGPVTEFLKIAPGLCTGIIQLKPKGDLFALLNELVAVADNRVIFNREQQSAIGRLMSVHSPADIKSAFSEFWGNIENDDFRVGQAAKNFVEGAEQLLYVQAKRREKEAQTKAMLAAAIEQEQARAREELAESARKQAETDALIEDELG